MDDRMFTIPDSVWDPYSDVLAFHVKFGLEYNGPPRALMGELADFRRAFLLEEAEEYGDSSKALEDYLEACPINLDEAFITQELEKQLDALLDQLYVLLGNAVLQGFNKRIFVEAWSRVHKANMAKVRAELAHQSKRSTTFDVVKPPGWEPPKFSDLLENHAHRVKTGVDLAKGEDKAVAVTLRDGKLEEVKTLSTNDIKPDPSIDW